MQKSVLLVILMSLTIESAFASHSERVDDLVRPLLGQNAVVGCVVGVFDDGAREVYGYGRVKREVDQPPNGDTIYEIGSVTKAFTGTLLADMVNRHELALETPLQSLMPPGVELQIIKDHPITLVDVASQSSGYPRLPDNLVPSDPANPYADYSAKLMFEFLAKYKLLRPPGQYEYSNFAVGMLGHVLAMRVGTSYEHLVVERICTPLGMGDTRITLTDEQRRRLAPPYNAKLEAEQNWDFDTLAGAGALRSSANDLLKLVEASLANDDRPVAKAIHTAWEKHFGKSGEVGVGLGWQIARDNVTRWHNGQTGGYTAAVYVHPPSRLGVVVLSNTATDLISPLAERIFNTVLESKSKSFQPPQVGH